MCWRDDNDDDVPPWLMTLTQMCTVEQHEIVTAIFLLHCSSFTMISTKNKCQYNSIKQQAWKQGVWKKQ